jgi:alginate O-acetyltransferase complex protein AlgI
MPEWISDSFSGQSCQLRNVSSTRFKQQSSLACVVFSSPIFLFLFLPVILTLYPLLPGLRLKNLWLLAGSLLFYAWGEPGFVLLMMTSTLLNYSLGLVLEHNRTAISRRWAVGLAIGFNLGLLAFFKYTRFIVQNANEALNLFGFGRLEIPPVALPIGISFFTFQALSYVLDVYRGESRASRNPLDVALYIFFFPQLIAGPIVRWADIAAQIAQRFVTLDRFSQGVRRFTYGLAKKVLIANTLAKAADQVFALPAEGLSPVLAWVGITCYALQIYFDFSGYSDMAIGLGKFFGFEFKENFLHPYVATSVRDFWRRWHISLSTWFRDYLYVPLGGNRCSLARNHFNLLVVFFLCGLWHGAGWTFVVWGLYHGLFLVLERTRFGGWVARLPWFLRHSYTLVVILVGWVFFRSDTLLYALNFLRSMVGLGATSFDLVELYDAVQLVFAQNRTELSGSRPLIGLVLTKQVVWAGMAGIIFAAPFASWLRAKLWGVLQESQLRSALWRISLIVEPLVMGGLLLVSAAWLADGTYNPFIYFRF